MAGGNFMVIFSPVVWLAGVSNLFSGSIISSMFYLFGAIYAYNLASQ